MKQVCAVPLAMGLAIWVASGCRGVLGIEEWTARDEGAGAGGGTAGSAGEPGSSGGNAATGGAGASGGLPGATGGSGGTAGTAGVGGTAGASGSSSGGTGGVPEAGVGGTSGGAGTGGGDGGPNGPSNPGESCADILESGGSTGDGMYWLRPGAPAAFQDYCDMTTLGGGWTQLIDTYTPYLDEIASKEYLYLYNGRWFRSPPTNLAWSWTTGKELAGTYEYFDGTTQSSYSCPGSIEEPPFGIGCSSGTGPTAKTIPWGTSSPAVGTCEICQDTPTVFGGNACQTGVSVFVRETCADQLVAIEPSIANTGDTITLEGTFCGATTVNFPGGATAAATLLGAHRATVAVPASAKAGDLSVTSGGAPAGAVKFRRASFGLGLQQFQIFDDQTNGPRQMPSLVTARRYAASTVAGGWVYVMGGIRNSNGYLDSVERARVQADGSLGAFVDAGVTLTMPRYYAQGVVLGGYVYVIGGMTSGDTLIDSVERAQILPDGSLGTFSVVPGVTLLTPRANFSIVVIGRSLYVMHGDSGGADESTIEAAPIALDGSLGAFADAGVTAATPRNAPAAMVIGQYVYVVGGASQSLGTGVAQVERAQINGDGTLGSFAIVPGVTLAQTTSSMPLVRLGSSLYTIGGGISGVQKAQITGDSLGTFSIVPGVTVPGALFGSAVATLGNYVHVIGGAIGSTDRAATVRASINGSGLLNTTTVPTRPYVNAPRQWFPGVLVGDSIYALGGGDASSPNSIEQATVGTDGTLGAFALSASTLERASVLRHSAAVVGNYVYVLGGVVGAALTTVERASIQADGSLGAFTQLPAGLAVGRGSHGTAVVGNYLYLLGGFYGAANTSVERAPINPDGTLGTFAVQSQVLTTAHTDFTTAVLGNYLYALGGSDAGESAPIATIERVALNGDGSLNGNFSASGNFVHARSYPLLSVIGGYLYAVGGDSGTTVERAAIGADGTLGAFAVVPGLVEAAQWPGFVVGNAVSYCQWGVGGKQMSLP